MSRAHVVTLSTHTPRLRPRAGERRPLRVQGRMTWRDGRGTLRSVSVVTRNASECDVLVECLSPARLTLYRLVHLQLDELKPEVIGAVPRSLREGPILAAVYRVSAAERATGTPREYALRLLVEPCRMSQPEPLQACANN